MHPIIDHVETYALRRKGQKEPAKTSQTFLVSYAHNDANWDELKRIVEEVGMTCSKEQCTFSDKDAYRVIVAENDVDINEVKKLIDK